jgi:L-threonylcarbamoyladenylate synthase
MTKIMKINPVNPNKKLLNLAAEVIKKGGLVVFPTETVYGLGADAFNPEAVLKIFKVKNRPADNPLIIHISNFEQFEELIDLEKEKSDLVKFISEKLWPGPVTLVVKKSGKVPSEVTGGLDTVAVRFPAHPVANLLIELSSTPIAAPSANLSGKPSPTDAKHIIDDLKGFVDIIIDSGRSIFGIESTIIDISTAVPRLLRPGPISLERLKILIPELEVPDLKSFRRPLAPGMKYRHYSPESYMVLFECKTEDKMVERVKNYLNKKNNKCIILLTTEETINLYPENSDKFKKISLGSRRKLYEVAHNLFDTIIKADSLKPDEIVVEGFREIGLGFSIMNRLFKAAHRIIKEDDEF